jgi:hypothetical protein
VSTSEAAAEGERDTAALRDGIANQSRHFLTGVYENLVRIDRKPTTVLRFPLNLLTDPVLRVDDCARGDENLPRPPQILRANARSAP